MGGLLNALLDQPIAKILIGKIDNTLNQVGAAAKRVSEGNYSDLQDLLNKAGKPKVQYQAPPVQEDPRVILGFGPEQKLTIQIVKDRKRKLAEMYHPDKGGSPEAMQRVNVAADVLIAALGGK